MKLFMMPQTVPNRPTNGAVAPIVAMMAMPGRTERASTRTISEKRDAERSLMPASLGRLRPKVGLPASPRTAGIPTALWHFAPKRQLRFAQRPNLGDARQRQAKIFSATQGKVDRLGKKSSRSRAMRKSDRR